MATLNQFKQEIAKLVKDQKAAKSVNAQYSVYDNRGKLHAMYVAYYILKHKVIDATEYLNQVKTEWKDLEIHGWCGYGGGSESTYTWKYFINRVNSLIDMYSDEETLRIDRPEA